MFKRGSIICYHLTKTEGKIKAEIINPRLRRLAYFKGVSGMEWKNRRNRVGETALF